MNKILTLTGLALICYTYSCNSVSESKARQDTQTQLPEREFYNFDIRNHLDESGEFLLSSVADEIRYIPLETNPACLISRCLQVDIFNNNIYVLDTKALYKFDMDGRFIRQIGRIGNGPGEYGSVLWFNFIHQTNEIILYSYPTGRINVHDAESGEFIRSFRVNFDPNGVVEFPPGNLAFLTWNMKQTENPGRYAEIYICNLQGDVNDSIPDQREPLTGKIVGQNHYYMYNGTLHYMDFFQDSLYSISEDAVKECYAGFGLRNKVNVNQLEIKMLPGETQFPDFLHIDKVLENEASFYITVEKGLGFSVAGEYVKFFYDKTSGRLLNCGSVLNDLDDGMPFWPKSVYKDSVLIDFCPAIEFLEYFQTNPDNPDRPGELKDLINTLDENDNPVVLLASQR